METISGMDLGEFTTPDLYPNSEPSHRTKFMNKIKIFLTELDGQFWKIKKCQVIVNYCFTFWPRNEPNYYTNLSQTLRVFTYQFLQILTQYSGFCSTDYDLAIYSNSPFVILKQIADPFTHIVCTIIGKRMPAYNYTTGKLSETKGSS